MSPFEHLRLQQTRRSFLRQTAAGLGSIALASLLNPAGVRAATRPAQSAGERWRGVVNPLHFAPRAKRVIFLTMAGGPSHLETFDNKPKLAKLNGEPMPESYTNGQQVAQLQGSALNCLAPQFPFARYGKSGQEISSILPNLAEVADDICIIRSMWTEQINHDPAQAFMNTGTAISGRPSMGSWVWYGLGSECENLPGFVVLASVGGGQDQPIAARQWHSGFLPGRFQGVMFRSQGDPVNYVKRPAGVSEDSQKSIIQTVSSMDSLLDHLVHDPEIAARISQYELAFRMQASVPELMDISKEPKHVLDLYGTKGADGSYAANCLLARRLAERGVRFIQLYHRDWDHHGGVKTGVTAAAALTDKPSAALITDLKNRGMLDDTLVVWGGEFGRTPMAQNDGRDHHIKGFSIFMAGGGIKPGISFGATDELGYNAVENPVHVHDLHATMLHLLGINHERLTYRSLGRDFRLTDVAGELIKPIMV